eukprot:COSAG02_NODE_12783_length_1495_cov_1.368195_2_plen_136_part_00
MLLRLGRIKQGDLVKCRRLFTKLDRCFFHHQLCALLVVGLRRTDTQTWTCADQCAVVACARDGNNALDDKDIEGLLQAKPDTAKLEDHDYNPHDNAVAEDSGMRSASDPNLGGKRVKEPGIAGPQTANPTFEADS